MFYYFVFVTFSNSYLFLYNIFYFIRIIEILHYLRAKVVSSTVK